MREKIVNLTFHGIGNPRVGEEKVWISRQFFVEILDAAKDLTHVFISFDDGNKSDVDEALPELIARRLKATFFIVAGRLGLPDYLTEQDLREVVRAGMLLGCHGMRHVSWQHLSPELMWEEMVHARDVIEQAVGNRVPVAACPFGEYGRFTLRALREFGYERVFTSDGGYAVAESWLQPRNSIWRTTSMEEVKSLLRRDRKGATEVVRRAKQLVKRLR